MKGAAAGSLLRSPALASGRSRVVRFVPLGDLAVLDPTRVPLKVTLHHAHLVFDTLYGVDDQFNVQPQMVEGHRTEEGGRLWRLTLRPGLRFHDGQPVLARDAVASIRRWATVDSLGQRLMQCTDALDAPDDRTIRFRLRTPFPFLPLALGKVQPLMLAIMPERLAAVPASTALNEMVGSGPFRFAADEAVPGSQYVYSKFEGYLPRTDGTAALTAGPKVVNVDRVEWHVVGDPAATMAALQRGELDWWERPIFDLLPTMADDPNLVIWKNDPLGEVSALVLNHLQPPFDKPGVCQALLGVFCQTDTMQAVAGSDRSYWRSGVGWVPPGSPWATPAEAGPFAQQTDPALTQRSLEVAGYAGERVLMMVGTDIPDVLAAGQVAAAAMRRAGVNVDFDGRDFNSTAQRRANRRPLSEGGWSCYVVPTPGYYISDPTTAPSLRGTGEYPSNGFMRSPAIEALYTEWLASPDNDSRRVLASGMQRQYAQDVPFIPMGQYFNPTAYRRSISNMTPGGLIRFWGLTKDE